MATFYVDPTKLTDATGGTAGAKANPIRPAQIAAFAANDAVFRFTPRTIGVGGFDKTDWGQGTKVEVGTALSDGFTGLVFETDPDEEGTATLTAAVGFAAGEWSAVTGSSNTVFERLAILTDAQAIVAMFQDYYGQAPNLWEPSDESEHQRQRGLLADGQLADNLDATKAAVAEGHWGYTDIGSGFARIVVHAWGDVNINSAGANYISYLNAVTPGSGHKRAALSIIESSNTIVRNLNIDRFWGNSNNGNALYFFNSGDAFGLDPEGITVSNCRLTDCQTQLLNIEVNSGATDADVMVQSCRVGGYSGSTTGGVGAAVRVVKFSAAPTGIRTRILGSRISGHYILGGDGAEAIGVATKVEAYSLKVGISADGAVAESTEITGSVIEGVEGASDEVVADVTWAGQPSSGDRRTFSAYTTRWDNCTIRGLSQMFADRSQAFRRCLIDLSSADDKATATGSLDIGSAGNTVFMQGCQFIGSGGGSPVHTFGLSNNSELIAECSDFVNSQVSSSGAMFGGVGVNPVQTISMYACNIRAVDPGTMTLANLHTPTFTFTDCAFDSGFADASFFVSNTQTLTKAQFDAESTVTGSRHDLDLADDYGADLATPLPGAEIRSERHAPIASLSQSTGINGPYQANYGAWQFGSVRSRNFRARAGGFVR